jgi:hypothetical protein
VPVLALSRDPDAVIEREGLGSWADGSFERLCELARAMWRDRDQQGDLGERCRAFVARQHSPDAIADSWVQALGLESR